MKIGPKRHERDGVAPPERPVSAHLPGASHAEIIHARFIPDPARRRSREPEVPEVGATDVLAALR